METRTEKRAGSLVGTAAVVMLGVWCALATALEASDPPAPEGRSYFMLLLGGGSGSERFEPEALCVEFDSNEMCTPVGCGIWYAVDDGVQTQKRTSFGFEIILDDPEHTHILGMGRADDRGGGSSIGGVLEASQPGSVANLAFAGRAMDPDRCARLVAELGSSRPE